MSDSVHSLFDEARKKHKENKKEEAEELYLKLINDFKKSPEASAAKRFLKRLHEPVNETPELPQWEKDHQVWACPECGKTSMDRFSNCPKCLQKVQSIIAYRRINIERILFIPFLMIIIFGLSFLSTASDAKALPLIVPVFYVIGSQFMDIQFVETYLPDEIPDYAYKTFNIKLFLKEGIVFGVIFILAGIGFAAWELLLWLRG